MLIGILSDTHDEVARTRIAVAQLQSNGAETLVHCGDLACSEIVEICSVLPFYFVFGNHDADAVVELRHAAEEFNSTCLGWGGEFVADGKRIAVVHGHLTMDLKPLLQQRPDYLFSGHSHIAQDWMDGCTRRINPGALFRAETYSCAILDTTTNELNFLTVVDDS